jgi:DNA-nicking Smr family endonuclease
MIVDDEDVWDDITKSIKPLKSRNVKKTTPVKKKIRVTEIKKTPVVPDKTPSPPPTRTIRQLKQQKITVQRKLDLHGMTIAAAHPRLIRFIQDAYAEKLRCVEIITGRGNPEKGTGQLKRHAPVWLREDRTIAGFIVHIEENPASRGGSYLVLLRRDKTAP